MTDEEIDALTAQHVMGWEYLIVNYFGTEDETPRQKVLEQWMKAVGIESVGEYWIDVEKDFWMPAYGRRGWQPTRDIAQAWQLITKFEGDGYNVILSTFANAGRWCCIFETGGPNGLPSYTGYGETAMAAICRCALAAVGKE